MTNLLAAGISFLGTHLGISRQPLRGVLADRLSERGYLLLYSLISFMTLGWLIFAFNTTPHTEFLWPPVPGLQMLAVLLMPLAFIFLAGAFVGRNPTAIGQSASLAKAEPARGLVRITRHPFQWAVVLWATVHILANGDLASLLFFSSLGLVSFFGAFLIDRKKADSNGEHWERFAASTSNVPFAAILSGRNRLVLRELWLPVLVGLAFYTLVLWRHEWVSGVPLPIR